MFWVVFVIFVLVAIVAYAVGGSSAAFLAAGALLVFGAFRAGTRSKQLAKHKD